MVFCRLPCPLFCPRGLVAAVLIAVSGLFSTACDKTPPCQARVSLGEKVGTGSGPDEATAKKLAWADYCVRHDPTVDGKHRVWKAAGGKSSGKKAEDIEKVAPLKRILEQCEKRSAADAAARVDASCKN